MKYILQQHIWYGNEPVEIELPDDWQVEWHGILADDLPVMTREQLRAKLQKPYGMRPLRELARGKQRVTIAFDDITRGTPTQQMAEAVLDELKQAGVADDSIMFLCALGTHGAHTRDMFVRKLGEEIVAKYPVYNHNCYEHCVKIGTTARGYDVLINQEFMRSDLRIGLGGIAPHIINGFSGGGKLFFPGLAYIETIEENHKSGYDFMRNNPAGLSGSLGHLENRGMREDIEEMTRMIGEVFKVDCLYNTRSEIVGLYCGDPVEAYYAGAEVAKEVYKTPKPAKKDVVIANANAKASEGSIALRVAMECLDEDSGGDVVVVNCSACGQITHYLSGVFGRETVGRTAVPSKDPRPAGKGINIYMSDSADATTRIGDPERFHYARDWEEVMRLLAARHGPGTTCSILADALLCYFD